MNETLATIVHGTATDRTPLLIVHGLFGSARNWGAIAKRLGADRQVISVDLRNHADSFWHDDHTYPALADDLHQVAERFGPVDILAHSMGGKAAMVLSLKQPEVLRRLIVADIAPVAYSHSHADLIATMLRADFNGVTRRSEADACLSAGIDDPGLRAFLLQSLDLSGVSPRWKINLTALQRNMAAISGFPEVFGLFPGPTLFLTGANSDYVAADSLPRIQALFPAASFESIPGAGHWLHAEKPRETEAVVRAFLS